MASLVETIVSERTPESLRLEFKRSDVLKERRIDLVCKAVSALANSDGGRIVFGIAEHKETGTLKLDGGVDDVPRVVEWLDSILSENIAPRIVEVKISSETVVGAQYIHVDVPRSTNAPHQSSDKRFYKRSNSRSFPMEAYEIDDVRNRRISGPAPLVIGLELNRGVLAHLAIFNRSEFVCRDLKIEVDGNFRMHVFGGRQSGEVSLSRIGIGQRTEFLLGSIYEILGENSNAAFEMSGTYLSETSSQKFQFSDAVNLGELRNSIVPHDVYGEHLKKISEELRGTKDEIKRASSINKNIFETIAGSGVRISPFSISQGRAPILDGAFMQFKYDAYGLTRSGMAEVLEVTTEAISEVYSCFEYFGGIEKLDGALKKLPAEVQKRFRERIDFEKE